VAGASAYAYVVSREDKRCPTPPSSARTCSISCASSSATTTGSGSPRTSSGMRRQYARPRTAVHRKLRAAPAQPQPSFRRRPAPDTRLVGLERRERRKVDDEQGNRRRRHRCECLRADPAGTIAASGTRLKPAIALLDMLTTPAGVQGHCGGLGWASAISPHRSGSDRSILSEVNHRLESRMREIHPSGLEGGGTDNRFSLSLYTRHDYANSCH